MYTSYFSKIKSLPDDIIPIAICAKAPNFYKGLTYKKLAPGYEMLMDWKKHKDDDLYIYRYYKSVLDKLDAKEVVQDLLALVNKDMSLIQTPQICLVCYEKSSDFCHRHLVAEWLTDQGWPCKEFV